MEVVVTVLAFIVLFSAGGLMFWAMWRSTALTQRLHPLTLEQRRRKRRAYAVLAPFMAAVFVLVVAIGSGGTAQVVAIAAIAAIVLVDVLVTPWLHYRRARRQTTIGLRERRRRGPRARAGASPAD